MKIFTPDPELIKKLDFKHPATWVATWFGCGLMRPAPGTWGTLGAMPFGILILFFGGPYLLIATIAAILLAGFWAAGHFAKMTGTKDHAMIVVDEAAGIWITLLASSLSPASLLLAFALFRFFDILKPWPISWCDRNIGGAAGVMADDFLAGVFAGLCLYGIHYYALIG